jgi:hypothetical protein
MCSRVTGVLMLGQEEGVEDDVHLQQGITIKNEPVTMPGKHPATLEFGELLVESVCDFDVEFSTEIALGNAPEF